MDTPKLVTEGGGGGGGGDELYLSSRGRVKTIEEREKDTTRDLLEKAVHINSSHIREGECLVRITQGGGGGGGSEGTKPETTTTNQDFTSSASSNFSTASHDLRSGGGERGGIVTASSSSASSSSAGFSSRASEASSITSDSSITTFSVSDKDTTTTLVGGRERSLSREEDGSEPVENFQGDLGISTILPPPLGLGLYHSDITTSPTLSSSTPLYVDHSDNNTSLTRISPPPRSFSGTRDSTILPSSSHPSSPSSSPLPPHRVLTSGQPRSGSPTPSTSTLTIDRPKLPLPPPPPPPPPPGSSPPRPPSLKGKERAIPPPPPSPSHSLVTLTTTTATTAPSEISSSDETGGGASEGLHDKKTVFPPENFAIVVPGIFRSSFPRKKNFDFLKSLGLKSVLTLIQDEYPQENLDFLEQEGIQLFQFPIPGNKEPFVHIPDDKIVSAMAVILDSRNHPLLIHCNKGKHRTGCLVGVLRRLQTWSLTAIFEEYRRFSHPKSRQMDLQFIEAFKGLELIWDLASQNRPHLPPWACTTPYSTPQRGKVPTEAKTKERSVSRAPSGRSSPVLKELVGGVGVGGGGAPKTGWCKEEFEKERGREDSAGGGEGGVGKGS
ncbi:hypothetical protein JCM3765_007513 [Sporobolomyces pararoseus]